MALINCKECERQISQTAKVCPGCGAKNARKALIPKSVAVGTAVVLVAIYLLSSWAQIDRETEVAQKTAQGIAYDGAEKAEAAELVELTPEQRIEESKKREEKAQQRGKQRRQNLRLRWNYSETQDQMGRGSINLAHVRSLNEVTFGSPYGGAQRMNLILRIGPEHGNIAAVTIHRGQFMCGYRDCNIKVRFGTGDVAKYSAVEPADGSTTTLFINDYKGFIANLKEVDTISIEAQFYQEGNRVFNFDVSDLEWPHP